MRKGQRSGTGVARPSTGFAARSPRAFAPFNLRVDDKNADHLRRFVLLALIIGTLAADQLTKIAAREHLKGRFPHDYGPVAFVYAENSGAFLSLGESLPRLVRRVVFDGLVTIGLFVAAWFLFRGRVQGRGDDVALALIVAGGAGNLVDRLRFGGYVTDFLYLHAGPLHTGVFNVADMAITGGVLWLALAWVVMRTPSRPARSPSPPPTSSSTSRCRWPSP